MRGSHHVDVDGVNIPGIIPAGAGLTRPVLPSPLCQRDHPRGCGAHYHTERNELPIVGSSPRVRGSRSSICTMTRLIGIIPAGAGLTTFRPIEYHLYRDHPRGCGAHPLLGDDFPLLQGSSPRVRGSPADWRCHPAGCGIIPAGAGLTTDQGRALGRGWDHPRGCGAHGAVSGAGEPLVGSSPRVRGSRRGGLQDGGSHGIIPAGAGLTSASLGFGSSDGDHPRGCGAHAEKDLGIAPGEGSSPRVRGSLCQWEGLERRTGIIPAGAGLTGSPMTKSCWRRDHPRGCGAHTAELASAIVKTGSSPRVRGSPRRGHKEQLHAGIIPAGAGLTVTILWRG